MPDNNNLVSISYFINDFPMLIEYFDLEDTVESIIQESNDISIGLSTLLDLAKGNKLSESQVLLFNRLCDEIENSLNADDVETMQAADGTVFSLHSIYSVIWLSYEGDTYKYFKSKHHAELFVINWR